jgi:hypothetical protein
VQKAVQKSERLQTEQDNEDKEERKRGGGYLPNQPGWGSHWRGERNNTTRVGLHVMCSEAVR